MSVAKLVSVYIKMRDKRLSLQKEFETADKEIKEKMDTVSSMMLQVCKDTDADSIKTGAGTIIRTVKTRYWTSDWHSMYEFIKDHNAIDLLEQRLHQTHVKQFLTENPDLLPPGLNQNSEYAVSVRKAK